MRKGRFMATCTRPRTAGLLMAGAFALLLGPTAALADTIHNTLDSSIDTERELLELTTVDGATSLKVDPTNGDGKQGCNLTADLRLVVSVISSDTSVATVRTGDVNNDQQLTFTNCGTQEVTIKPRSEGTANITFTEVFNNTEATFDLTPANFRVKVSAAPAATQDTTALVITSDIQGTKGADGWYTSDVALSWSVADPDSAITAKDGCNDVAITSDQEAQTYTCTATSAGGTDSTSVTIKRDASEPQIASDVVGDRSGNLDWYTGNVTIAWDVSDPTSGVGSRQGCGGKDGRTAVQQDGKGQEFTCSATNGAGLEKSRTKTINLDATPPVVALKGDLLNGSSYYFGFVPTAPTCEASDVTSGLSSECTVVGYRSQVGSQTVVAKAQDVAGNRNQAEHTYNVLPWDLKGFNQPVNMGRVLNTVKAGSTVPFKFEVFAGNTELTDPAVVESFSRQQVSCASLDATGTDAIEITTTGGTSLRYDATGGQFVQNWKTPAEPGSCYKVTMETQDGSALVAIFKLTR
jgi:hypothetical protein